jgi:hypothetical protein
MFPECFGIFYAQITFLHGVVYSSNIFLFRMESILIEYSIIKYETNIPEKLYFHFFYCKYYSLGMRNFFCSYVFIASTVFASVKLETGGEEESVHDGERDSTGEWYVIDTTSTAEPSTFESTTGEISTSTGGLRISIPELYLLSEEEDEGESGRNLRAKGFEEGTLEEVPFAGQEFIDGSAGLLEQVPTDIKIFFLVAGLAAVLQVIYVTMSAE